jgi:hypothetical protein
MDGLQVANPSHGSQAVSGRGSDKFPHPDSSTSQTYTYPSSTTSNQPIVSGYQQEPVDAQGPPPPIHDEKPCPPDTRYRIPFGLSVIAYTAILSAIILVICGAAFGGAIAAVAGSKEDECSYVCYCYTRPSFPSAKENDTNTRHNTDIGLLAATMQPLEQGPPKQHARQPSQSSRPTQPQQQRHLHLRPATEPTSLQTTHPSTPRRSPRPR